jgi:hypothetical protein
LLSGDPTLFSVDPTSGNVYALQNLPYSVAPSYTIYVGARSNGGAQTDSMLMFHFVFFLKSFSEQQCQDRYFCD